MRTLIKLTFIIATTALVFACGDKKVLKPDASLLKKSYKIGDVKEGGIIFYIDSTGEHGLVAKANDEVMGLTSVSIPDNNTPITSNIVVSGIPGTVGSQLSNVCININHPYAADLDVYLRAPNGSSIELTTDNGGGGDNYTETCFISGGTNTVFISSGSAPFTGNYIPEQPFILLGSSPINGTWSLIVYDDVGGDVGSLINWSMNINFYSFASPVSNIKWNNGTNFTTGASGGSKGTGASNTSIIVSAQGAGAYAAYICDALSSGGYSDWYLPSSGELYLLYQQKNIVGGFAGSHYWSSSESSSSTAYVINFSSGWGTNCFKSTNAEVRAIRSY